MRAVEFKCPNCNASLKVGEAASVVTCEYCNVTSAIQRRTRIFERALPPQLTDAQRQMQLRIAVQKHSSVFKWIIIGTVVLPLVIVAV